MGFKFELYLDVFLSGEFVAFGALLDLAVPESHFCVEIDLKFALRLFHLLGNAQVGIDSLAAMFKL
jgi:hypothetical protein